MRRNEGRQEGTVRAGTGVAWREHGTGSPPATKGTGTGSPSKTPTARSCWPNELKLSDGGWRRKGRNTEKAPPPASVRWSALLGARRGWEKTDLASEFALAYAVNAANEHAKTNEEAYAPSEKPRIQEMVHSCCGIAATDEKARDESAVSHG